MSDYERRNTSSFRAFWRMLSHIGAWTNCRSTSVTIA